MKSLAKHMPLNSEHLISDRRSAFRPCEVSIQNKRDKPVASLLKQ